MTRLLTALVGLAVIPAVLGAPVPKHLFPKDPSFRFPTTVGTKWLYECGSTEETIVISDVKEEQDGSKLVTMKKVYADGTRTLDQVTRVSAAGVYVVAGPGGNNEEPTCLMKLPLLEGQKWEKQVTCRSFITSTTGPVETVRVPAGIFAAVRIDHVIHIDGVTVKLTSTLWYAHGVGLVKTGGNRVLKSFTLGED